MEISVSLNFVLQEYLPHIPESFSASEIDTLVSVMGIPDPFKTAGRYNFSALEVFCLLLAHLRSAGEIGELTAKFNQSASAISEGVNELVLYLDVRWSHLLEFDKDGIMSPSNLACYAAAIHAAGAPLTTILGFIDCTIWHICRPTLYQRIAYSGHKKFHALKFQAVQLPNGLIGHLFGLVEGRHADPWLLTESGLLAALRTYAIHPNTDENTPDHEHYFQIFGDPAYGVSCHIMSPFAGVGHRTQDEQDWNNAMAATRIEVEHGFGGVTQQWPMLNAWWKLKINTSPVGRYYRVAVLLTNALNCIRPNQTSQYFDIAPPELHKYFHD